MSVRPQTAPQRTTGSPLCCSLGGVSCLKAKTESMRRTSILMFKKSSSTKQNKHSWDRLLWFFFLISIVTKIHNKWDILQLKNQLVGALGNYIKARLFITENIQYILAFLYCNFLLFIGRYIHQYWCICNRIISADISISSIQQSVQFY